LVDLADGTTFGWNSGPETGNVLVGNGVTVSTSGGNNGGLAGHTLFYDSTTFCNPGPCTTHPPGSGLQNPPPTSLVSGPSPSPGTVTGNALASANSVAANIANATGPNLQTFASITSGQTITGVAGINVIDVANIMNAAFRLSGPANAIFVFNVSGAFNTNQPMTLSGGVTPSDIIFNFTGTSGTVFQTSGGDVLYGTFLAVDGGGFQFSELDLTGALIMGDSNGECATNASGACTGTGGGNIQLVSGSQISFEGFTPTPIPAALPLFATGLGAMGLLGWRRKRKAQTRA
jgi:hypothetical protein